MPLAANYAGEHEKVHEHAIDQTNPRSPSNELPPLPTSDHPPRPLLSPPARRHQGRERRIALRTARDARLDVFRWSGVILVEDDPSNPFYLSFHQYFPRKWSPLVVSSEPFRSLATGLGPIDFPTTVRAPTLPAGRSTGRPSGSGTGPGGPLARPAAAGGSLLPIAGVRRLQEAGPRAFYLLPALPPLVAQTHNELHRY